MRILQFKSEFEDLSLMYLKPDMYKRIEERKIKLFKDYICNPKTNMY